MCCTLHVKQLACRHLRRFVAYKMLGNIQYVVETSIQSNRKALTRICDWRDATESRKSHSYTLVVGVRAVEIGNIDVCNVKCPTRSASVISEALGTVLRFISRPDDWAISRSTYVSPNTVHRLRCAMRRSADPLTRLCAFFSAWKNKRTAWHCVSPTLILIRFRYMAR